jgi:biotin carboxylase
MFAGILMPRRVLFLRTAHDQMQSFEDAAMRLGVQLVPFDGDAVAPAVAFAKAEAIDACVAADSRAAIAAASVTRTLGIPGHPAGAAEISRSKLLTRERLRDSDLLVPWFFPTSLSANPAALAAMVEFPCVVKPTVPSEGRAVARADDAASFVAAFADVRDWLAGATLNKDAEDERTTALVEGYIDGWEFALEGVMHHGALNAFALFDKPDPLEGPRFDDSVYVTPSLAPEPMQWDILDAVSRAAAAVGLHHGPMHAECRVADRGVFVLGVAARPLARGWAKALRFQKEGKGPLISYEELLLRHALGESADAWRREAAAAGAKKADSGFTYATAESAEEVERVLRG